ncbi:serine/threonine-protein kinase [Spirulina sp. CS-785/01]|uniref:serine/threonine-protein kinase n=1 Tax=Spirulina sp. CS-785/01 TaxID=3021716 RepID=UPI00232E04F2|nr:serine/threonine-protein kinase [Spirulina sp. CS-785/01]
MYCPNPLCRRPINADIAQFCQGCGTRLSLGQRYRLQELLGMGGFGRTFLAEDLYKPSKPYCVVKQFYPQETHSGEKAAYLFQQEAVRLEELGKHPQIPELYAHFEQEGQQYIVQEWIDGQDLGEELAKQGPFSERKIEQLLREILPLLQYIHGGNVIHRDIKPENIIRRKSDGRLFLVDFGAAKYATESVLGKTGTSIGSLGYTAPEQTLGKASFASDLYSLGVTCLHLLTQVSPLELYDVHEAAWQWKAHLKFPLREQWVQLLEGMLVKATRSRFQSAQAILQQLDTNPQRFLQGCRCEHTLTGHTDKILSVAFSPDGKYLASGSCDRTVNLWELGLLPDLQTLTGHQGEVTTLAFTPQQQTLITGSRSGDLLYWQLSNGKRLSPLTQTCNPLMTLALHPKRAILVTGGANHPLKLWKFPKLHPLGELHSKNFPGAWCLTFSPDGQLLASGGINQVIYLWDMATGQPRTILQGHRGTFAGITSLAFSPDGQTLASSSQDRTVKLWDVATGQIKATLPQHQKTVTSVAFSPDGHLLASGGEDAAISLWSPTSQQLQKTLLEHKAAITSLAFSPDGKYLASGSLDKTVKLWSIEGEL